MQPTILIAEDNDSVAAPLEQLLQKNGYNIVRAKDGAEALSIIVSQPPDLLLLDLKMPRLHGVELLKKIRLSDKTKDLPVVVMTGIYRGDKNADAARQLGVKTYLEKPFRASDLLDAITTNLSAAPSQTPDGTTFDKHLQYAFLNHFSGTMNFAVNNRQQVLSFVNGTPISLRQGINYDDFGAFLQNKGIITAEEYIFYKTQSGFRHDMLVQIGCLDYPELMQEKLSYLGSELVAAFALPPFATQLNPVSLPPDMQIISINLPRIFYGGYHMHPGNSGLAICQQYAAYYPTLQPSYFQYINFFSLKTEEQLFLQKINGSTKLVDCFENPDALIPFLQTLLTLEMISFSAEPATNAVAEIPIRRLFNTLEEEEQEAGTPETLESFNDLVDESDLEEVDLLTTDENAAAAAQSAGYDLAVGKKVRQTLAEMTGKNHYELFGIRQGEFSFDKLKEKYFAITHEFGPELMMQLSGEEAGLVEEILSLVSTAYNTLSNVVKKERYDELLGSDTVGLGEKGDDKFQAQVQSQSGKVFIEMGEWDNAIKAMQDAVNIDQENGDYLAHLGWAIYKNPANARSKAMRDQGKQMINRSLTLERTAQAHAFKGWIIFEVGQDNLAEAEFNKALKIDARNSMARSGLRELREKKEQDKKGLFKKMFR
jgi:DNA-binding response OmpR family regulator/tetratricopeptide (TPR) repeat protein